MTIQEILDAGNYHLVDVREPMELITDGAIEGALNVPLSELEETLFSSVKAAEEAEKPLIFSKKKASAISITAEDTVTFLNWFNFLFSRLYNYAFARKFIYNILHIRLVYCLSPFEMQFYIKLLFQGV